MEKYWIVDKDRKLVLSNEDIRTEEDLVLFIPSKKISYFLKYTTLHEKKGKIKIHGNELFDLSEVEILSIPELAKREAYKDFNPEFDVLWFSNIEETLPDPYSTLNLPPIMSVTCLYLIKSPNGYMLTKADHQRKRTWLWRSRATCGLPGWIRMLSAWWRSPPAANMPSSDFP